MCPMSPNIEFRMPTGRHKRITSLHSIPFGFVSPSLSLLVFFASILSSGDPYWNDDDGDFLCIWNCSFTFEFLRLLISLLVHIFAINLSNLRSLSTIFVMVCFSLFHHLSTYYKYIAQVSVSVSCQSHAQNSNDRKDIERCVMGRRAVGRMCEHTCVLKKWVWQNAVKNVVTTGVSAWACLSEYVSIAKWSGSGQVYTLYEWSLPFSRRMYECAWMEQKILCRQQD